jgi:hypothetical protein
MPIKDPILSKEFLALRTNFIPNHPTEHITLRYYQKDIRWSVLLQDALRLEKKLPATIVHDGKMHNWAGGANTRYFGLWVSAPDATILDHLKMPHITVPVALTKDLDLNEIPSHEIVAQLWLGYKVNGQQMWSKINNKQIGVNDVDWELSGLI